MNIVLDSTVARAAAKPILGVARTDVTARHRAIGNLRRQPVLESL